MEDDGTLSLCTQLFYFHKPRKKRDPMAMMMELVASEYGKSSLLHFADVEFHVGETTIQAEPHLRRIHPIQRGVIVDMRAMKMVWDTVFIQLLNISPDDCCLIITQPAKATDQQSEALVQAMFDAFVFQLITLVAARLLSMYSNGYIPDADCNGIVVEMGGGLTDVVPIYGGSVHHLGVKTMAFGGEDITGALAVLMNIDYLAMCDKYGKEKETSLFATPAVRRTVNLLKENLCYVPTDPSAELATPTQYNIPSIDFTFVLESARFRCVENVFDPYGSLSTPSLDEGIGLHELVHSAIVAVGGGVKT